MYTSIKTGIVFIVFITLPNLNNALCSFDCDDEKCCYAGISTTQCRTWNGTETQLGETRPHRVLLFSEYVCGTDFDGSATCEPPLPGAEQALDVRESGNLLFIKATDKVLVLSNSNNTTYSLKTTSWFPQAPPSRLQISNHGACEWIDNSKSILCELHGELKQMETVDSCDAQPLLNAFNLVAIIGICVSLTTLCLILAYYKVSGQNYAQVREENIREEEFELVQIPEDEHIQKISTADVIDALI